MCENEETSMNSRAVQKEGTKKEDGQNRGSFISASKNYSRKHPVNVNFLSEYSLLKDKFDDNINLYTTGKVACVCVSVAGGEKDKWQVCEVRRSPAWANITVCILQSPKQTWSWRGNCYIARAERWETIENAFFFKNCS